METYPLMVTNSVIVVSVPVSSLSSSCNHHDASLRGDSNPVTGLDPFLTALSNAS